MPALLSLALLLLSALPACSAFAFSHLLSPDEIYDVFSGFGDFFRPRRSFLSDWDWQPPAPAAPDSVGEVDTQEAAFGSEVLSSFFCGRSHRGMLVHTANRRLHVLLVRNTTGRPDTLEWVELGTHLADLSAATHRPDDSSARDVPRPPRTAEVLAVFQNPHFAEMFVVKQAAADGVLVTTDCGHTFREIGGLGVAAPQPKTRATANPPTKTKTRSDARNKGKTGQPWTVGDVKFSPLFRDWILLGLNGPSPQSGARLFVSKDFAHWQDAGRLSCD